MFAEEQAMAITTALGATQQFADKLFDAITTAGKNLSAEDIETAVNCALDRYMEYAKQLQQSDGR